MEMVVIAGFGVQHGFASGRPGDPAIGQSAGEHCSLMQHCLTPTFVCVLFKG